MTPFGSFTTALRKAPLFAHVTAAVAMVVWIVKATWLDFVVVDSRVLVGLGHVVDGLLSAIIAGYVFFVIFAVYPDFRQRTIMAPFLLERMRSIVGDCSGIIEKVQEGSNRAIRLKHAPEAEVAHAFAATATNVPPRGIVTEAGGPMTWPAFFNFRYARTAAAIDELLQQSRFLDAEVISLLAEIRNAPFYRMSRMAGSGPLSNPDLSAWAPSFHRLLVSARRLSVWHDANLVPGVAPFRPTIPD